jgi:NhaA family Na+:H+ antiporter
MNNSKETFTAGFLKLETSGGIVLMVAALAALVLANTPLASFYALLIDTPVEIRIGEVNP